VQNTHDKVINRITDNAIVFIAVMAIPLNVIIYFALSRSEYQIIRYIPPLLGAIAIFFSFSRFKIDQNLKLWGFITLQFTTACFNLLLGLIDIASLWFVLSIIFALFISKKKEALFIAFSSFTLVFVVGVLMVTKISFIPLKYDFENCQFACVAVRVLHFILIGWLIYYILNVFFTTIRNNTNELQLKTEDLEKLNIALNNEMIEKKTIQENMLNAVILTEENERKRFARDLHDGLGPVLSATNLFFQAYIDTTDDKNKVELEYKLKEIIGDAIKDVSRISHNISPHILESYGLITALENFIQPIQTIEKIQFNLDFAEMSRLNVKDELIIYRAVTELINNTLKHAKASKISVKITVENGYLDVYYNDNGIGFANAKKIGTNSGMGLNNIHNRINSLGGNFVFESSVNQGMKAQITIPQINKNEI